MGSTSALSVRIFAIALFVFSFTTSVFAEPAKALKTASKAEKKTSKSNKTVKADGIDPLKEAEDEYDKGKFESAKKKFEAVLRTKLKPEVERRGQHLLALSYFGLGDTRKAIDYWESLYDDNKEDDLAFKAGYNLGLAYSRLGNLQKAYDSMAMVPESSIQRQPAPIQKAYNELLGQTATAIDRNENAVLAFTSSLKVAADEAARKSLLDQIAAAALKLSDVDQIQKLADRTEDADAKQRILDAKKKPGQPSEISVSAHGPAGDWTLAPGLGVSHLQYTQTGLALLQLSALGLSLHSAYHFSDDWSVFAAGYVQSVILKTVGNSTTTRLLMVGGGVEYRFLQQETWSMLTRLSYTYASLLTPGNQYGFRDLAGPQLYFEAFIPTGVREGVLLDTGAALLNNDTKTITSDSYRVQGGLGYRLDYSSDCPPLDIRFRYTRHSLAFSASSAKGNGFDLTFSSDFDF